MTETLSICPVCGSEENKPFLKGNLDQEKLTSFSYASRKEPEFMNFPLVSCESCDLVYTTIPPSNSALNIAYEEAAYDSSEEANFAARTYLQIIKPYLREIQKKCAIDIGSGNGALLPLLLKEDFERVIGVEPSKTAIDAALPEIKSMIRQGLFSAELIHDVTPDFIFTAMTMEHVKDPLSLMKIIKDRLSSGGIVAVVVHNRRALLNRILGKRSPIIDIEHLQLFSPISLEKLFTEAGLELVKIESFSNTYPLRYWMRLLPLPTFLKRGLIKVLDFVRLSHIPITMPVGNILGIARKID
jgi:SAM-dependent methyltransferase